MLTCVINNKLDALTDDVSILADTFNDTFELKLSPTRFSIMAATSPSTRCILALQLSPRYFAAYNCTKLDYKLVQIPHFYNAMRNFHESGFTIMALAFFDSEREPGHEARNTICRLLHILDAGHLDRHAVRIVAKYDNGTLDRIDLPFCASTGSMDDTSEFDCAKFISIESQDFINIITGFSNFDNVLVTISSSQVKFSYGRTATILTQEENQCIIGGIEGSEKIIFAITLQPTELFCNFVRRSKRVWISKSMNSLKGVIAAPLGLYSRYLAYFPPRK